MTTIDLAVCEEGIGSARDDERGHRGLRLEQEAAVAVRRGVAWPRGTSRWRIGGHSEHEGEGPGWPDTRVRTHSVERTVESIDRPSVHRSPLAALPPVIDRAARRATGSAGERVAPVSTSSRRGRSRFSRAVVALMATLPPAADVPNGDGDPYTAYSVSWNLTQRCNLECAHCYMSAFAGADTRGELTTEECRRVIDEIAAVNPNVFLILTGGEPLLRKRHLGHRRLRGREAVHDRVRHQRRAAARARGEADARARRARRLDQPRLHRSAEARCLPPPARTRGRARCAPRACSPTRGSTSRCTCR